MKVWAAICGGKVGNVGNGLGGCAGCGSDGGGNVGNVGLGVGLGGCVVCGGDGKLTGICGLKGTVAAGGRKGEGLAVGLG